MPPMGDPPIWEVFRPPVTVKECLLESETLTKRWSRTKCNCRADIFGGCKGNLTISLC